MPDIGPSDLMHATLWRQPFTAEGWVFENKLDGFRALVRKTGRAVELLSRNGRSMAAQFAYIVRAASPAAPSSTRNSSCSTNAGTPCSTAPVAGQSCA